MRILAIGAHPDDIEIGCGGTLLGYAQAGHSVMLLVMTDGSSGGNGVTRRLEQEAAARILNATHLFWGDYPDTYIPVDRDGIQQIERFVKELAPDMIFVHSGDDTHQDHRNLCTATVTATRYTPNVLFYEGPTTANFAPTVFVNLDQTLEQKVKALAAHASQMSKTHIEQLNIIDIARAAAHFRGIQGRMRNAEGFVPLRLSLPSGNGHDAR